MPNPWEVEDYPYAHTSNPYAAQQPSGSPSYGSGSENTGSNWNSPHPPNAAYVSDDGMISYDASGYQLDSLGNRAFGTWPNSNRRSAAGATGTNGATLGNWYSQPMGQMGIPGYSLTAWGRPAEWWTNPANQQVAQAEAAYYMPWQQQLYNQYTTGQQYDNANQQWAWNANWGAMQDLYNMGLTGAQTAADINMGYGTLEQNALANMYDYNLGMGNLANDQYRTSAEAYANLYRPYMEAGANMYNSDTNAMLGLGDQSRQWAQLGQDYQLGLAEMENQQVLESMRQFGRNKAPNVRAMRNWY